MKSGFERVNKLIDSYESQMVDTMLKMIPLKAISPQSGGEGESKRADFLEKILRKWGFETKRYDYKDNTGAVRSNILAKFGETDKTIWFVPHMDTVSEGDINLWKSDPFVATVDGGKIYGRGVGDNGQSLIASIFALRALKESKTKTKYNFGLIIVADEEVGSRYGMERIVHDVKFNKNDMFMVPDGGLLDGKLIEVGEKGILWLKITVTGVQAHASMPDKGKNAFRYAAKFINEVDILLHSKYSAKNKLFLPEISTFEMTKHEKNVDSVNIIPGTDVFYIDCRVLPDYKLDDVIADVVKLSKSKQYKDVKIDLDTFNREDPAPITDPKCELVRLLESCIKELRGIGAKKVGIGGGTVASFVRKKGLQAAVWSTVDAYAFHKPNEYILIKNMLDDAKVFAYMVL